MPLESVIDVRDINAVLQRAVEADQLAEAASISSDSDLVIDLDATGETNVERRRRLRKEQGGLHASSLRVPRRPPWHNQMTVEELNANARRAFLVWCRNLARCRVRVEQGHEVAGVVYESCSIGSRVAA